MQLTQCFIQAIHLKVHNKRLIARRERLEDNISSQVLVKFRTKSVQSLNLTIHFDHMRTDWATFWQLARKQGLCDIEPLSPGLVLKYPTQPSIMV